MSQTKPCKKKLVKTTNLPIYKPTYPWSGCEGSVGAWLGGGSRLHLFSNFHWLAQGQLKDNTILCPANENML